MCWALHGVDALGRVVLRRTVRRERLLESAWRNAAPGLKDIHDFKSTA